MRKYEVVFIIDPDLEGEKVEEVINKYSDAITGGGGEVVKVERWGLRRLAYKIKHKTKGEYVRIEYIAPPPLPKQIEETMRMDDAVMRFLTVKLDERVEKKKVSGVE